MYARPTEAGELLDFGVSGKLIMNALVMYDRQTESLWSQILGSAVDGPLKGSSLQPVPSTMTTWGKWRELHPDTVALDIGRAARDRYEGYYRDASAGILGEDNSDDRLPPKALVAGAVVDGVPTAYAWTDLESQGVVNDLAGETPLLVFHDPPTATTLLFDRRVNGRELTFHTDTAEEGAAVLVDDETGTRWSAWNGAGFEGPLTGTVLERIPSTGVFWFAWSDFHPDSRLWRADSQ